MWRRGLRWEGTWPVPQRDSDAPPCTSLSSDESMGGGGGGSE